MDSPFHTRFAGKFRSTVLEIHSDEILNQLSSLTSSVVMWNFCLNTFSGKSYPEVHGVFRASSNTFPTCTYGLFDVRVPDSENGRMLRAVAEAYDVGVSCQAKKKQVRVLEAHARTFELDQHYDGMMIEGLFQVLEDAGVSRADAKTQLFDKMQPDWVDIHNRLLADVDLSLGDEFARNGGPTLRQLATNWRHQHMLAMAAVAPNPPLLAPLGNPVGGPVQAPLGPPLIPPPINPPPPVLQDGAPEDVAAANVLEVEQPAGAVGNAARDASNHGDDNLFEDPMEEDEDSTRNTGNRGEIPDGDNFDNGSDDSSSGEGDRISSDGDQVVGAAAAIVGQAGGVAKADNGDGNKVGSGPGAADGEEAMVEG